MVRVAVVSMLDAVRLAAPNCPESAMEKHPAWAAAINSSGFVPGVFSNRVLKEYGVLLKTPLDDDTAPLPSFSPPFQTALALRCIFLSSVYEFQTPIYSIEVGTAQIKAAAWAIQLTMLRLQLGRAIRAEARGITATGV